MSADIYLAENVRYRLFVHPAHEGQIGPDAEPWEDGRPMHYAGIIFEHVTAAPDFDGRAGHVSWKEARWCPGVAQWCAGIEANRGWTLESFDPLSLSPSIQCTEHPEEFHVFIREGALVWA